MSSTLNFFNEHPLPLDETHKILSKIPSYEAQLLPIRQMMLSCCAPEQEKDGSVRLVVADLARWKKLSEEQAAITGKIEAINRMVVELDTILDEIAAAGIEINRKTLAGIWNAAPRTDPPLQRGEYVNAHGKRVDQNEIPLKSQIDPRFLAWNERAQKAMAEAGL